jgi:hypothetical protein
MCSHALVRRRLRQQRGGMERWCDEGCGPRGWKDGKGPHWQAAGVDNVWCLARCSSTSTMGKEVMEPGNNNGLSTGEGAA